MFARMGTTIKNVAKKLDFDFLDNKTVYIHKDYDSMKTDVKFAKKDSTLNIVRAIPGRKFDHKKFKWTIPIKKTQNLIS